MVNSHAHAYLINHRLSLLTSYPVTKVIFNELMHFQCMIKGLHPNFRNFTQGPRRWSWYNLYIETGYRIFICICIVIESGSYNAKMFPSFSLMSLCHKKIKKNLENWIIIVHLWPFQILFTGQMKITYILEPIIYCKK